MKKHLVIVITIICAVSIIGCSTRQSEKQDLIEYSDDFQEEQSSNEEDNLEQQTLDNDYVEIPAYEGIEIDEIAQPEEITDEDVDEYIDAIVDANPEKTEITDRASEVGDLINFDYQAADGTEEKGIEVIIGDGEVIDDLDEVFVDLKAGDSLDCEGTISTIEDPHADGDPIEFTITINGIYTIKPSEVTDQFVKQVSDSSTTVEEYRNEVKSLLEQDAERDYQNEINEEAWDILLGQAHVKAYDDKAIDELVNRTTLSYQQEAADNMMTLEEYLPELELESMDEFNDAILEAAQEYWIEEQVADIVIANAQLTGDEIESEEDDLVHLYEYDNVQDMKDNLSEQEYDELLNIQAAMHVVGDLCIQVPDDGIDEVTEAVE